MRAVLFQQAHDFVRETIFPDTVAETDQLVDITHQAQRLREPCNITVQVRDDADLQGALRQAMIFIAFRLITTDRSWFSTSHRVRTTPRSGFERERVASRMESRTLSTSPGRTGRSQRSSSMPGEPRLALLGRKLSTMSRIIIAALCQPLAISPPKGPWTARLGSTWMYCGSKRRAN